MRISRKTSLLFLILTISLAAFLYFLKLDQLPNSLSDDEATVGYNALSILNTGKDEYGKTLPLAFRLFRAYTPPLFIYLAAPLIGLFGLSAVTLRAISAVFTLFGILIVFEFIRSLDLFKSRLTAPLAAFIFSICPWVFYYARIGYEVTAGYITFAAGALFLWYGVRRKKLSFFGLFLLSISTYIAHTERFLVPVFLLTVFVSFRTKNLIPGLVFLALTQLPNLYLLTTKAFWVKGEVFGDFNPARITGEFVNQYLTYLSPKALFGLSPDINLQHTAPAISLFYSWLIIPFFIGLYRLYLKARTPGGRYLLLMLLTAPFPGALSGHYISVQRVLPLIIPLIFVLALGFDYLVLKIRPAFFWPVFCLLTLLSLTLLWRSYFIFFPKERSAYWSYGYEQLAEIIRENPEISYVIDTARAETGYSGLLFYLVYPPAEFQKQFPPEVANNYYSDPRVDKSYAFGNIKLRGVSWEKDPLIDQVLVGDPLTISDGQAREHFLSRVFEIKDPNGRPILIGYQTNPARKRFDNLRKAGYL